jgi:hypothetical protein
VFGTEQGEIFTFTKETNVKNDCNYQCISRYVPFSSNSPVIKLSSSVLANRIIFVAALAKRPIDDSLLIVKESKEIFPQSQNQNPVENSNIAEVAVGENLLAKCSSSSSSSPAISSIETLNEKNKVDDVPSIPYLLTLSVYCIPLFDIIPFISGRGLFVYALFYYY